jgi:hypothetical protein
MSGQKRRRAAVGAAFLGVFGLVYGLRLATRPVGADAAPVATPAAPSVAAPAWPGAAAAAPPVPGQTAVSPPPSEPWMQQPDPPSIIARPEGEWEGMPIDRARQAQCETTASCSLARSCRGGRCGACEQSGDCLSNEGCVLQHCVRANKIGCRSRHDCARGELCILSDYSEGPRGNEDMRSFCNPFSGGREQIERPDDHPFEDHGPRIPARVEIGDLRQELEAP